MGGLHAARSVCSVITDTRGVSKKDQRPLGRNAASTPRRVVVNLSVVDNDTCIFGTDPSTLLGNLRPGAVVGYGRVGLTG